MSGQAAAGRDLRRSLSSTVASLCALLAALLQGSALASPGTAAIPSVDRLEFGAFIFHEPFTEFELQRFRAGGGEVLRTIFQWREVQSTPLPLYDWSEYDALVARAAAAGVSVLPVLIGSPNFVAPRGSSPPTTTLGKVLFALFGKAAAERYGRSGEFWDENPSVPYRPIEAWEIWNEPNLSGFWTDGQPNAGEYAALLKLMAAAVRSGDPDGKVVLAGMPDPRAPKAIPADEFLADVYAVDGTEAAFDVVGAHPYAGAVRGVDRRLALLRDVMARNGDEQKPLWITELGWSSAGINHYLVKDRATQARLTRGAIAMLRRRADEYRLGRVIWFRWQDPGNPCPKPGGCWYDHAGLFTTDERPKPAWTAYARGAGGRPLTGRLPANAYKGFAAHLDAAG